MPRHPPNALTTLNRSHCQCSSSSQTFLRTTNRPGYLLQPSLLNNAIDVFDPVTLLELRRAAHLCQIFKTSFSRSNPVPRGQATVIRSFIRRGPKAKNNERSRATSFLPTSSPSPGSGRLGPHKDHQNWARTWDKSHTWKPPDQSSLHNVCRTGSTRSSDANFYFFKGYLRSLDTLHRQKPSALVELSGIEPLTPCLQSRCSPS